MIKQVLLICLLSYLISCTSSDNRIVYPIEISAAKPVKTSIKNKFLLAEQIKQFDDFLNSLSSQQMVAASETDLHRKVKTYLPDSLISEGFDLHMREIGRIDTFRFVFHEYFDLYDDWSKTYLNVFSPSGRLLDSQQLWELSFEGSTSINFLNDQIVEIAYHDFFEIENLLNQALIPNQNFYLANPSSVNNLIEGTVYQYFNLSGNGKFRNLTQNTDISDGRHFPQSSAKILSSIEVKQYTIEEIKLMKNEILAEHGYSFNDTEVQQYFENQSWYSNQEDSIKNRMTDIERLNFDFLSSIEKEY